MDRWAQAMENMQDARQAANVLVRTVDEAIYMVRPSESYSLAMQRRKARRVPLPPNAPVLCRMRTRTVK